VRKKAIQGKKDEKAPKKTHWHLGIIYLGEECDYKHRFIEVPVKISLTEMS